MTLLIPGSPTAAIILGGLLLQGLMPICLILIALIVLSIAAPLISHMKAKKHSA